jgi:predicted permease
VASYVTPNHPNHWGVKPILGRWLVPADAPTRLDAQPVTVLGYAFWQRYFSGDPNIVGKTIELVRKKYTIVGVMPPRFKWRDPAEIYMPLAVKYEPNRYYGSVMKIRKGVTAEQASAALLPLIQQFAKETPDRYPTGAFKVRLRSIVELYARPMGPRLYLLLGAVMSLLVIGCANVSILLLVRGSHRSQELAIRSAIGAARLRIVRQLLTESLAIATAGALLGLLLAWKGLDFMKAWIPTNSFASESVIRMNVPVLLASIALAVVTSVLFGLWPAVQLSRPDMARVMQASSRRVMGSAQGKRTHRIMIAAQVALTVVMLSAAGAAGKGFLKMTHADLGYDPSNAMSLPIPVHEGTYGTWEERAAYFEKLRAAVAALPQVESAGISTNATPPANGSDTRIAIFGVSSLEAPVVRTNLVSEDYFSLLRIPVTAGRLWNPDEMRRGATMAVVNQTMAKMFWPKGDAIGRQLKFASMKDESPLSPMAPGGDGWLEVIGVVADARNDGLREPIKPSMYVPYTLKMRMFTQILVRTRVPPLSILRDVRAAVARVDHDQQVMRVNDLSTWITDLQEYGQMRLVANLFAIFSALALALSAVGLYSVVSYSVTTRTNEFGIRMALGAQARDVVRMVLSSTTGTLAAGLGVGVLLSIGLDKIASQWVTESSRDPIILASVTAVLLAVAALACLAPARRAASIDPMAAVRHE